MGIDEGRTLLLTMKLDAFISDNFSAHAARFPFLPRLYIVLSLRGGHSLAMILFKYYYESGLRV